mgnify:CR=1 FL=1
MEIRGNKMIRTFFVSCATFLIASCGGGGSSNSVAPSITDPGALSVQEGSTGVTSISASDSDGDAAMMKSSKKPVKAETAADSLAALRATLALAGVTDEDSARGLEAQGVLASDLPLLTEADWATCVPKIVS